MLAGVAGGLSYSDAAQSEEKPAKWSLPGAIALKLGETLAIRVRSIPVKVGEGARHIVSIGSGTFKLDEDSRLTAFLKRGVSQFVGTEYRISVAVFDADGQLLGTASHDESVQYVRLPVIPTIIREMKFDWKYNLTIRVLFCMTSSKRYPLRLLELQKELPILIFCRSWLT
jgi:hypothetical protein